MWCLQVFYKATQHFVNSYAFSIYGLTINLESNSNFEN